VFLFFVGVSIAFVLFSKGFKSNGELIYMDTWVPVSVGKVENTIGLIGKISASSVTTITAPFDAVISDLPFAVGDEVAKDSLIARLDSSQYQVKVRQALAELIKAEQEMSELENWGSSDEVARARRVEANAKLNFEDSKRKLQDAQRLLDRGIVPRIEVESLSQQVKLNYIELQASRSDLKAAIAKGGGHNMKVASINLKNARFNYQKTSELLKQSDLRSPYKGVLFAPVPNQSKRTNEVIQKGQYVSQGTPLVQIAKLDELFASALISEVDLQKISTGMSVSLTGEGFRPYVLKGRVQSISLRGIEADITTEPTYYNVVVSIGGLSKEQSRLVRIGLTAKLNIVTYINEKAIIVPFDSVLDGDEGAFVYYKESIDLPERKVRVRIGQSTSHGIEIFGVGPGLVKKVVTTSP